MSVPPNRMLDDFRWTWRLRAWKWLHERVNPWAWRLGLEAGWTRNDPGCGLHIRNDHPLWRLNDWLAAHWSEPYLRATVKRSRAVR